jgi:hypothetical protein
MEKVYRTSNWQHLLSFILPPIKDHNRINISISKKNEREMMARIHNDRETKLPRVKLVKGYDLFW